MSFKLNLLPVLKSKQLTATTETAYVSIYKERKFYSQVSKKEIAGHILPFFIL